MEEITIYKFQLDRIIEALRVTSNIHQSSRGRTCHDRMVRQAYQYAKNAMEGKKDEEVRYVAGEYQKDDPDSPELTMCRKYEMYKDHYVENREWFMDCFKRIQDGLSDPNAAVNHSMLEVGVRMDAEISLYSSPLFSKYITVRPVISPSASVASGTWRVSFEVQQREGSKSYPLGWVRNYVDFNDVWATMLESVPLQVNQ